MAENNDSRFTYDGMPRNKLLGSTRYISYDDINVDPNLIVIGDKETGKTSNWVIPNARWINSYATIITDKDLVVREAVSEWNMKTNEISPLRQYIFDAELEDSFKFNPFTADFGDSTKKVRHLARAFLAASKNVPQKEEYFSLYVAIVCAVYFGVTSKKNDLSGLKDTMSMRFVDFKAHIDVFINDSKDTFQNRPSFMDWLAKFNELPVNKASEMFEMARNALAPFFTDEALKMGDTHNNTILPLDIRAYKMYVNLKEDRYSTTNCMFAVFLDAVLDRQIFFSSASESDPVPYKHIILDDVEYIPLSPHVRKNIDKGYKYGVTTTVLARHVKGVAPFFEGCEVAALMGGGEENMDDLKFLSETFNVPLSEIQENNKEDNILIFQKGHKLLVDKKAGTRGIF